LLILQTIVIFDPNGSGTVH